MTWVWEDDFERCWVVTRICKIFDFACQDLFECLSQVFIDFDEFNLVCLECVTLCALPDAIGTLSVGSLAISLVDWECDAGHIGIWSAQGFDWREESMGSDFRPVK